MPPTYIIIYRTSTIYEQQSVNTQLWHLMAITDLTTLSQRTILSQWRIRGGGVPPNPKAINLPPPLHVQSTNAEFHGAYITGLCSVIRGCDVCVTMRGKVSPG